MSASRPAVKPRTLRYAELALWAWTAWTCLLGVYQTWTGIPEIEQALGDQFQGLISLEPGKLLEFAIAGYAVLAAFSAWVILKIGSGKHWARSSLMWGFVLEVVIMLAPPYHAPLDYMTDVPDLGLQIYALYLLYTQPGDSWFE